MNGRDIAADQWYLHRIPVHYGFGLEEWRQVPQERRLRLIEALPAAAAPAATVTTLGPFCGRCAHPRDGHEHYRAGTDCSADGCRCRRYRPVRRRRTGPLWSARFLWSLWRDLR